MATRHFIASKLRELDPVGCLGDSDAEIIEYVNACRCCGEPVFDDAEIDGFISRSETAMDFLQLVYETPLPHEHKKESHGYGYEGSEHDN